jgi:hypothetical protein
MSQPDDSTEHSEEPGVSAPADRPAASAAPSEPRHEPSATQSARPSATNTWTRRVKLDLDGAGRAADKGLTEARRVAGTVTTSVRAGASQLAAGVSRGAGRVGAAFDAPSESELGSMLSEANLPELEGDPLEAIARRLDREADLWRELSLRALARAAWADRVAQTAAVGAWLVSVTGALLGLLGGALGGARSGYAIGLALASIGSVLAATGLVAWVSAGVRRTQGALAGAALERADLSELRLQRLGVVLALRREDPALFPRALARLESDTRGVG